ncbi:MAG TPA: ATP-binding cassette domain-containing protein [Gammaproteobacteria bacterium]
MADGLTIKQLRTHHVGPLDLAVAHGECVVLSGASGAGKTLLLRAIADLDEHEGEVRLDGHSCRAMRAHEWRRRVALLPAESQWWGEHIGDHFSRVDETLLGELGFRPEVMGWQVARCSTGERQRLALLRLLQHAPEVLLLDEPTASLDAENVARVEALLQRLRRERQLALLWVSHDTAQTARVATRRLQIVAGKLQERA